LHGVRVHYEVVNDCPIFDYTDEAVERLFRGERVL
jgi:hypothetical protein